MAMSTLYEDIGGQPAVMAAVDLFYQRVLADSTLTPFFEHIPMQRLKGHQAAFLTQALNGPETYKGRSMREAHAGRGITDADFDRVAMHLVETLAELGVPATMIDQIVGRVGPLRPEIVEPSRSEERAA